MTVNDDKTNIQRKRSAQALDQRSWDLWSFRTKHKLFLKTSSMST